MVVHIQLRSVLESTWVSRVVSNWYTVVPVELLWCLLVWPSWILSVRAPEQKGIWDDLHHNSISLGSEVSLE